MEREKLAELGKGDLIEYTWYDILIDETGDPTKARLLKRRQYGLFLELKVDAQSNIECLITAGGIDIDEDAVPQSGWQTTPISLITKIKRIRKASQLNDRTRNQRVEQERTVRDGDAQEPR